MVKKFPEVIHDDLPKVPLKTEIDIDTHTIPDIRRTFISPHRMTPAELKELKELLKDL